MWTIQVNRRQIATGIAVVIATAIVAAILFITETIVGQSSVPIYSISAMACTPNGETARLGLVDSSHGNARFAGGRSGTIYLICPFTDASLHGRVVNTITVTISGGANGTLTAALRASDQRNDNVRDVLVYRNTQACLGTSATRFFNCSDSSQSHSLDFNANYYYVQISMSTGAPRVYGVTIQ
ncbi:hypothetical protein ARNL5_00066 [Anaerolineae bacterium]|nr:hypothetical protein ARNL5_00066 [Anaerolineae bacterium]